MSLTFNGWDVGCDHCTHGAYNLGDDYDDTERIVSGLIRDGWEVTDTWSDFTCPTCVARLAQEAERLRIAEEQGNLHAADGTILDTPLFDVGAVA